MPRRSVFAVLAITTVSALLGITPAASPVRPGDRVGNMLVVRGTVAADLKLFDICDPVILLTLREWRVMLVNATPGVHTLRYRTTQSEWHNRRDVDLRGQAQLAVNPAGSEIPIAACRLMCSDHVAGCLERLL